ncbi:hypothetical protein AQUCO_06400026v1 [Aquilegia coerulea]|uniref:PB1 domain-containing protein n=1 Tax=Aquilegia coerulea TaxID=218851 RepID=A0A2G5CCE8_AQUCA|nr:hypothetical protein AQUCO_06400026v1 [Aquilegia coerulea]
MGKPSGKKSTKNTTTTTNNNNKKNKKKIDGEKSKQNNKSFDADMEIFISMSNELKEEGNKLFQKRDHEGAMLKYEKALQLLPSTNKSIEIAYLRTNMAACYMQMGVGEYPRAINECNLALQVFPRYTKALLKRCKCYQGLDRLVLAFRDVNLVLKSEPNNIIALDLAERLRDAIEKKGIDKDDEVDLSSDYNYIDPSYMVDSVSSKGAKSKNRRRKKKVKTDEEMVIDKIESDAVEEEEVEEEVTKTIKLVFGEDIRLAQMPINCSIQNLRDIVRDRFECSKMLLIKYKDQEGDLITITSNEELRWAEASGNPLGSLRFYVVEVNSEQEPPCEGVNIGEEVEKIEVNNHSVSQNGNDIHVADTVKGSSYIDDWIIQFAQVFKTHVGFSSDEYLDLHELTMKLHSHAMEDMITNEEAQGVFDVAADNFQEMAALAFFNWGNVHMSRARKNMTFTDDMLSESVLLQARDAYEWSKKEYVKAGMRYEEALRIKPDFYEAHLAIGQQQFEQAKLSWCYAIGCKVDLATWPSAEVLELFNKSEENMEKGTDIWEKMETLRLKDLCKDMIKIQLQKWPLNDISSDREAEQSANMRSQINLLWGIILYERSVVECKLRLPVWKDCLEVALEKFELAGVSPTDIAVIIKNHCANQTSNEGLGFKVDEIVQAWNDMHNAKRWKTGVPSFRLEQLFHRRIPKLHHDLEQI